MTPLLLFLNIFLALIESSLFQSSWRQPPQPPRDFFDFLPLIESSLFSIIMRPLLFRFFAPNFSIITGGAAAPPNPPAIF